MEQKYDSAEKRKYQSDWWDDVIDEFLEEVYEEEEKTLEEMQEAKRQESRKQKFNTLFNLFSFLLVIWILLAVVLYLFNRYFHINVHDEDGELSHEEQEYVDWFEDTRDTAYNWLDFIFSNFDIDYFTTTEETQLENIWNYDSLEEVNNEVNSIINSDMSYMEKKDEIEIFLQDSLSQMDETSSDIEYVRENLSTYGYLSRELDDLIADTHMQRALLSIESIKFFTAMNVFEKIDSFVDDFLEQVPWSERRVRSNIENFLNRWEQDIQRYLSYCYLNPFENSRCNRFWDFDNYYDGEINVSIFKELISAIDEELEFEEIPRLAITLNNMWIQDRSISFSVDINTFTEDHISLANRWIRSPHIHITNTLINTIRGSSFIVWKDVTFATLDVNDRTVRIQDREEEIRNSRFNFDVPIQKDVQREIFDFIYDG